MYGDTRGHRDGTKVQAEHSMVIESMLATIRESAARGDSIRFVLQSGDAVENGSIAQQLAVSYIPLITCLTQEGGVPYFLAVGNHDVGTSMDLTNQRRVDGVRNYFAANANLIPPDGSPRRLRGYPAYSFGYGNTFFIALDSDIPDDPTQLAWLESQLRSIDRKRFRNVAAFFHHPPFSSGLHGGPRVEPQAASIRRKWMPLFRRYHVRLLFVGHEHLARPSVDARGNPHHYVVVHVDGTQISLEVVGVDWGKGFAPYQGGSTMSLFSTHP